MMSFNLFHAANLKKGALVFTVTSSMAFAADWPTYMHDANRSGVTSDQLSPNLVKAWVFPKIQPPAEAWADEVKKDSSVGVSSQRPFKLRASFDRANHIAVAGGFVYIGSATEHNVQCLKASTGEPQWIFFTEGPVRMAPTYANGKVFVGSDDGAVYCLDASHGSLVWKYTAAGSSNYLVPNNGQAVSPWAVRSGVLVDQGVAYFAAGIFPSEGVYLSAVDALTGVRSEPGHWQTFHQNQGSMQGYMLMSPARIFIPGGRSNPYYFNRTNGVLQGQYNDREASGSFALLTGDSLYFGRSGRTVGRLAEGGQTGSVISTISDGNAIVVADGVNYLLWDNKIAAQNRASKVAIWSVNESYPHTMILAGNTVYVGGDDKVAGFDAATGNKVWSSPVDGKALGLAVSDGRLYVSTDKGLLYAFSQAQSSPQSMLKIR